MAREEEGEDVDARSDPAVVRVLRVTAIHHVIKKFSSEVKFLSPRGRSSTSATLRT
jgi:hypothetical protein